MAPSREPLGRENKTLTRDRKDVINLHTGYGIIYVSARITHFSYRYSPKQIIAAAPGKLECKARGRTCVCVFFYTQAVRCEIPLDPNSERNNFVNFSWKSLYFLNILKNRGFFNSNVKRNTKTSSGRRDENLIKLLFFLFTHSKGKENRGNGTRNRQWNLQLKTVSCVNKFIVVRVMQFMRYVSCERWKRKLCHTRCS